MAARGSIAGRGTSRDWGTLCARLAALIALAAPAFLLGLVVYAWTPNADPARLIRTYTDDASRFARGPGGMRIHYRDEGPRDAPVLFLLHGSGGSLQDWDEWTALLTERYRVIRYDQPAHGLTGPRPDGIYNAASMADALDAVAAAAEVERFAVAGNSMGGWVAWRYALARPSRVSALILLDASGTPEAGNGEMRAAMAILGSPLGRAFAQRFTPRPLVGIAARSAVEVESVVSPAYIDRHYDLMRFPGNRRAMLDLVLAGREPETASRLDEIEAPTLILWGREDGLVPLAAGEAFAAAIPDSRLVVYDETGHLPMNERPARSAADADAFLRGILSAGSDADQAINP